MLSDEAGSKRSWMNSAPSCTSSSLSVTERFCVLPPVDVNVTDLVTIRKSFGSVALTYSVAVLASVPVVTTCTFTAWSDAGSSSTVTGTVTVPLLSALLRSCRAVAVAALPKAMLARLVSARILVYSG